MSAGATAYRPLKKRKVGKPAKPEVVIKICCTSTVSFIGKHKTLLKDVFFVIQEVLAAAEGSKETVQSFSFTFFLVLGMIALRNF